MNNLSSTTSCFGRFQSLLTSDCCQSKTFKVATIGGSVLSLLASSIAIAGILLPNSHCPVLFTAHFSQTGALIFAVSTGVSGGIFLAVGIAALNAKRKASELMPSLALKVIPIPTAYWCSDQNSNFRPNMEDADISTEMSLPNHPDARVYLLGVFDGHGGNQVAEYIKSTILQELYAALNGTDDIYDETKIEEALGRGFLNLNTKAKEKCVEYVGSCALVGLVIDNKLHVANLGDSRAVHFDKATKKTTAMSEDDKAKARKEEIEARGGTVVIKPGGKALVKNALEVGASIGDWWIEGLIREPRFQHKELSEGDLVILACDGLWDVVENEEATSLAAESESASAAQVLVDTAIKKWSKDNITVGVYFHKLNQ